MILHGNLWIISSRDGSKLVLENANETKYGSMLREIIKCGTGWQGHIPKYSNIKPIIWQPVISKSELWSNFVGFQTYMDTWWRHQIETFPRYWSFVRGIHRFLMDSPKNSDAELWYFLWSAPEHTVEQAIGAPVIWDAIAHIMTSLYWMWMCAAVITNHKIAWVPLVRRCVYAALTFGDTVCH